MMETNRAAGVSSPVWTHERMPTPRSSPEALEALAVVTPYQRGQEIYSEESSVGCWYRVISGAARRFAVRADGRRQIIDLLLPGDMFGFGVRGKHVFAAEAITADTVIARYPIARLESLVASDPQMAGELRGTIIEAISRLHALILILGRTTAREKVGSFLLYMEERVASGKPDRLAIPITRYDIADYLAISVETVSRSLTDLKQSGAIALSGPRQIGIVDRDALANDYDAGEPFAAQPSPQLAVSRPPAEVPRTRSVNIRVPGFAFGDVLSDMRGWLDHRSCAASRFTCVRDGSGAVVVRVDFANANADAAKAFEQQFAASSVRDGR
jgi:CRP/FNR family transcriptional regulator, nitrogen fixation regulation protein